MTKISSPRKWKNPPFRYETTRISMIYEPVMVPEALESSPTVLLLYKQIYYTRGAPDVNLLVHCGPYL